MKEYLLKLTSGKYILETNILPWEENDAIEIPEWGNFAYIHNIRGVLYFSKTKHSETNHFLIWQRTQEKPLEYLDPSDWSLKFIRGTDDAAPENWILVPEGADTLAGSADSEECRYFWNHVDDKIIGTGESLERYPYWMDAKKSTAPSWVKELDLPDIKILWQRHTLPDELPFIDDHPPAHFVVRPKPRQRVYAVMGRRVISHIEIKIEVSA